MLVNYETTSWKNRRTFLLFSIWRESFEKGKRTTFKRWLAERHQNSRTMPNVFRSRDAGRWAWSVGNGILFAGWLPFLLSTISVLATGHFTGSSRPIRARVVAGFYLIEKDWESRKWSSGKVEWNCMRKFRCCVKFTGRKVKLIYLYIL